MPNQVNASIKMTRILRDRVQKVEREEQREELRQIGIRAHDEYMQTGLRLTNAEVKTWLADLARGNAAEPPECHTR